MGSKILITFSLMLGCARIVFAQINYDDTNGVQFASGDCGSEDVSASRCIRAGNFTNQHPARLASAAQENRDPGLSYSMPPSPESGIAESNQPSLTSRVKLADPALTASPHGWRIGGAGVLNYTAPNRRWRFVVGYSSDIGALRDTFGDLRSFNLAWQYSLGKRKPASWVGVKTGTEYLRRPPPR